MITTDQTLTTTRDVEVVRIPSGEKLPLPAGTTVHITQALGGSFTLMVPSEGGLFRLAGTDADAIGHEPLIKAGTSASADGQVAEEAVWEVLRSCYDPEIPVNIVDLGLIYGCEITPGETGSKVAVSMTLTAPGCGMGPVIAREAEEKILTLSGVADARVEVVWDPPWSPALISPAGKEKLGME